MTLVKFIHAADLHIDSPLRGLESYEGAPLDQLRGATRQAAAALVQLAIDQSVDFVVIAGDLFDGRWQDMHTGLWTAAQFRRLHQAGIQVFLLQGNHDAASKVRQAIQWPENVHLFSSNRPETVILEQLGVALHGQGFAHEKVSADLAAGYPDPIDGLFNIGVLHTSLTGSPEHDTYAPTRLSVLINRAYDYWALGHIHARSEPPLNDHPFIAYCGNIQGRHIKETGPKGCLIATIDDGQLRDVAFHPTDALRWEHVTIQLEGEAGRDELLETVTRQLSSCHEHTDGRLLAVRVTVQGACRLHEELTDEVERTEVVAEIRNLANAMPEGTWVEKILFATSPPIDMDRLRQGNDLVGQLLRNIDLAATTPELLGELSASLRPLADKAGTELQSLGLDLSEPDQVRRWIREAEAHLVARLLRTNVRGGSGA